MKNMQENKPQDYSTEELRDFVNRADVAYYTTSEPIASDLEYDAFRKELEKRDPASMDKVGAPPQEVKIKLPQNMASLDKIRDDPKALSKWLSAQGHEIVVMDKLDGNSGLLEISPESMNLYSRGDGSYGQSLKHILPTLDIPRIGGWPKRVMIRGELIIPRSRMVPGKNLRNYVSGLLNRRHADNEVSSAGIRFVAYSLVISREIMTLPQQLDWLKERGFEVPFRETLRVVDVTESELVSLLRTRLSVSPYDIDGIVLASAEALERPSAKNPTSVVAFKSMQVHESAIARVIRVEWNVSKDSLMKPVIVFEPVQLSGVTISRATGINAAFIRDNSIGPGAVVKVVRSGDVIPRVVEIVVTSPTGPGLPVEPCEWSSSGVDLVLIGDSQELKIKRLYSTVVSLGAKGVGYGIVEKMFLSGIDRPGKLFAPDLEATLLDVDGFGLVLAKKVSSSLLSALRDATPVDLAVASGSFGRGMGMTKLAILFGEARVREIIQREWVAFQENRDDKTYDYRLLVLPDIAGVGPAATEAFKIGLGEFFEFVIDVNVDLSQRFLDVVAISTVPLKTQELQGRVFAFSGIRDEDLEQKIISHGGQVKSGLVASVDTLVVKSIDPLEESIKVQKALKLGIRIIDIQSFKEDLFNDSRDF